MSEPLFVSVCLDQNVKKSLDYSVPDELQRLIQVGKRVEVPLKTSIVKGTITAIKMKTQTPNVKPIQGLLSVQGDLTQGQLQLANWMSSYYLTPLQKTLKCFIPPNIRKEIQPKKEWTLFLKKTHAETMTECGRLRVKAPQKAKVLEALLESTKGVAMAQFPWSSVQSLVKGGWVEKRSVEKGKDLLLDEEFFPTKAKVLNDEQLQATSAIQAALDSKRFSAHLLYGVTGSGKTEVYLQAIAHTLSQNRGVILLVPEVALTSQTIERFRARFTHKIAILHHKRSFGEKTAAWQELKEGKIQLVIGARSAIFCPIQNLGLVIVDEEHDGSYKQNDETPCYSARDVAVMRAYLEGAVAVLGSATPSLESRYNADLGKYQLHTLKTRAKNAQMPTIQIVDMQGVLDKNKGFTHFSDTLLTKMKERLEHGEQTLLLLNRRGYHRLQICKACKTIAKCPHCDLSLTYHRASHVLKCHLCNYTKETPRVCSSCGAEEGLSFQGFGTEHVERSLQAVLPGIRTLRMDRDTTQKKDSHEEMFQQFRSHKADVLIGTQMIAKGFHFPSVTLVGVLNVDAGLSIPDFRSPETIFQLLMQVAGRAGRSELKGEVILQTFFPEHPVLKLAKEQNFDAFYEQALEERRNFDYPPFCHLVKLLFSSKDEKKAEAHAAAVHDKLTKELAPPSQIFPITPAGHPKVKDVYRFQFLIKTPSISLVQKILEPFTSSDIRIDVDPSSTFF